MTKVQTETVADPEDEIRSAEEDAARATELLASLEERVRDGDASVSASELAEARSLQEFARLRIDAAERRAEAAREARRSAAIDAVADSVRAYAGADMVAMRQAYRKIVEGVATLDAGLAHRKGRFKELHNRVQALSPRDGEPVDAIGNVDSYAATLVVDGQRVQRPNRDWVLQAVEEGHGRPEQMGLGRGPLVHDLHDEELRAKHHAAQPKPKA